MRKPSLATALAGISLFVSLGGTSIAASHYLVTSKSQIAPSVRRSLRGHRGRQGPRGLQGIPGATGAQGSQGVPGLDGTSATFDTTKFYYRSGDTKTLSAIDTTATATAQCDAGDRVINGGFFGQNEIVTTDELETVIPAEWDVVAHLDPSASSGSVGVWLVCAVR